MKKIFNLSILVVAMAITSCTKVLDANYAQLAPQLVIEGLLLKDSLCYVKLSMTKNYYDTSKAPAVTTGFIVITDNLGNKDTVNHIGNGIYKNDNLIGVIGNVYTLTVRVNGTDHVAQSVLPDVTPIDSLGYVYDPGGTFNKKGYYPIAYAQEPQNQVNFYMWKFYRNDTLLGVPNDIWISDDKLVQQNIGGIRFPYAYKSGDKAKVEFFSLTKDAYDFFNAITSQINSDGGFFSTPPANTPANFSNGAIGLFQAGTVNVKSINIP